MRDITVFYETIDPSDIKQGCLGDSWVVCALASISERPSLVERLFVTKEVNEKGVYRVKLCKNGEWVSVTIDDYFPCFPLGEPLFSRAQGNELWVLLLEKAYAKVHDNFFSLRGGFANEALMDFTGCPTTCIVFEEEEAKVLIENGTLWEEIKLFDEEGYLLSLSTPGEDRWAEQGFNEEEEERGLMPGHSYTIVQVKEVKGNRLFNIRNPWTKFEWEGDWGPNSSTWTDEMRQILSPDLTGQDGSFWMNMQDALKNFFCLNVCKVRNWDEVRIKGKFIKIQEIDDPQIELLISKWYYSVELKERSRIIFSLHQEDERICGVALSRPNLDISIAILKRTSNTNIDVVKFSDFEFERQTELEITLEAGSYIILPRTSGCSLRKNSGTPNEEAPLLDREGNLSPNFKSCINDIFRKFDMLLNRELSFNEFKGFYECLSKTIGESDFRSEILDQFSATGKGLTLYGFRQFWKRSLSEYGEETIYKWLHSLGYDRSLYSLRSRVFILTIHR